MLSLESKRFEKEDDLCEFANEHPYMQIVSIVFDTRQDDFVVFYKEDLQ